MTDFGSGIFLTQDLDFEVTTTGDIQSSTGADELEKDIAIQSIIQLQDIRGIRGTPQEKARLRNRVRNILTDDPRISYVSNLTIRFIQGEEKAEIVASVSTIGGNQELVFEV